MTIRRSPRESFPSGAASSVCIVVTTQTEPNRPAIVNSTGELAEPSPATSHANPVATISEPRLLSGRLAHVYRPGADEAPADHEPQPDDRAAQGLVVAREDEGGVDDAEGEARGGEPPERPAE